jgi:hypothetical protein
MHFFRQLKPIFIIPFLFSGSLVAKEYPSTGIPELPGEPSLQAFPICYKHTCAAVDTVSLNPREWSEIVDIFKSGASSPEAERLLIKKAVARLEVIIGKKVNTLNDKGKNMDGMFVNDGYQMDCIDESSNTTTYLALMQKDQLLKWHKVQPTKTRGFFIFGLPHTTAVIKENQSEKRWAVDSWFHDNGVEPEILPISIWSDGWDPEDNKRSN